MLILLRVILLLYDYVPRAVNFLWIVIIRKDEIKKRYTNFQQSVIKNSPNIHQKQKS